MIKALSLQDIDSSINIKTEEQEVSIDYTDFYSEDYEKIIKHSKPIQIGKENISVFDLLNIPDLDDEKIISLIEDRLGIDLDSKKGIDRINLLLYKSITLMEKRYKKTINTRIKKIKIKSKEELLNFLRETRTNKTSGFINCAIAKISYAVNDVISNHHINKVGFLDEAFLRIYMDRYFQLDDEYEENGVYYRSYHFVYTGKKGDRKIIDFKCIVREKSENSIIGKEIADPKYFCIDEFKDLVGCTIYVDNSTDAAILMSYIDQIVYSGEAQISNKNGLDLQEVKENVWLNEDFYLKLEKETKKNDSKKSEDQKQFEQVKGTDSKYKEIKLVGYSQLPMEDSIESSLTPVGTEIKFVLKGQDNEQGLALHDIYDIFKKFRELTRLGIPIRKLDIVNYINDFFENLDELLRKKNKTRETYLPELLKDLKDKGFLDDKVSINDKDIIKSLALGLFRYYESQLVKVKIGKSKRKYYFCKRGIILRNLGLQKKDIQEA